MSPPISSKKTFFLFFYLIFFMKMFMTPKVCANFVKHVEGRRKFKLQIFKFIIFMSDTSR